MKQLKPMCARGRRFTQKSLKAVVLAYDRLMYKRGIIVVLLNNVH